MSAPLIFQILFGIVVVLFLVTAIMGHKSWKAYTIVLLFFVFMGVCTLMTLSAMALRTHQAWRQILEGPPGKPDEGLIRQTLALEEENHQLQFGEEKEDGEVIEPGIVQLQEQLKSRLYDRGRVWTDCQPSPLAGNSTTVQVSVPQPRPSGLTANAILFVFDAKPLAQEGSYLGEFRVAQVNDPAAAAGDDAGDAAPAAGGGQPATITMEPAWPISPAEMTRLVNSANRGGPWLMHEKMPADSHIVFNALERATAEELGVEAGELANLDRAARLHKLLPPQVLVQYVKDYQAPADGDSEERLEELVEFQQDYPVQHGDTTLEIKKKQVLWWPKASLKDDGGKTVVAGADELVASEVVELEDEQRYVRPLRDYAYLFRELYLMRGRQRIHYNDMDFDVGQIQAVLGDKQTVVASFEDENRVVAEDRDRFRRDLKLIDQLAKAVREQAISVYRLMTATRQENVKMARRLDQLQMEAVKVINQRTPSPQARRSTKPEGDDHIAAIAP